MKNNNKPVVILASKSPRRQEIFRRLEIPFTVKPCDIDEATDQKNIEDAVLELAEKKLDYAVSANNNSPENWIFAADTLVFSGNRLLGQPETEEEAYKYLKMLSSVTHQVATGIALYSREKDRKFIDKTVTDVEFPELDDEIIRWYISTGEWKGAGRGIQDTGKGGMHYREN